MSHVGHDTFAMVINIINVSCPAFPTHMNVGIFEMFNTTTTMMANQIKVLLE
jgi:hypothetical protein